MGSELRLSGDGPELPEPGEADRQQRANDSARFAERVTRAERVSWVVQSDWWTESADELDDDGRVPRSPADGRERAPAPEVPADDPALPQSSDEPTEPAAPDQDDGPEELYVDGREYQVSGNPRDGIWISGLPGEAPGTPEGDPYGVIEAGDVLAGISRPGASSTGSRTSCTRTSMS